jgi:hypothetical protein
VAVTVHYKTTTSSDSGSTDASGNASVPIQISGASVGYPVGVTVTVGSATCYSSFTPS